MEAVVLGDGGPRHTEIVRLLVAAGADPDIADRDGITALAHARKRGYSEMVSVLERAGAK
jgi:ankyrin repeat protein